MRPYLLLVLGLLHVTCAAVLDEAAHEWTLRDTEDDGEEPGYFSGEASESANSWLQYSRDGDGAVQAATVDDVDRLQEYLRTRPDIFTAGPNSQLESYVGEQMEDGPNKIDGVKRVNRRPSAVRTDTLPMAGTVLDEVESANFYPEFAIGILDNGCTTFLVGPRHALTAAHCVYNSSSEEFDVNLDMWRGRKGNEYLDQMLWSRVIIPQSYSVSPSDQDNWALIIFQRESLSTVWLKLGFSEEIYNMPYTLYGYLSSKSYGTMYTTVCRSRAEEPEEGEQVLNVQCGSDECFDGGPLLRGYNFRRSKMPVVYGVSFSSCDSYDFSHNNVLFQPTLFWTLCYLMSENGFDARCAIKAT